LLTQDQEEIKMYNLDPKYRHWHISNIEFSDDKLKKPRLVIVMEPNKDGYDILLGQINYEKAKELSNLHKIMSIVENLKKKNKNSEFTLYKSWEGQLSKYPLQRTVNQLKLFKAHNDKTL
jgi:hypothetical protein